jgi:MFS family permease
MALKIVVGVAALLILWLGYMSYRRGLRRGIMAMMGSLLGAIMVGFWGEAWGRQLAVRYSGATPQQTIFLVSSLVFLFCVLVVGYGGGSLLGPKEHGEKKRELASLAIGLVNGIMISSYLLRYGALYSAPVRSQIQSWMPSRILHDGLPLFFLLVTLGTAAIVIGRLLMLLNRALASVENTAPAPGVTSKPISSPPVGGGIGSSSAPKPAAASTPAPKASPLQAITSIFSFGKKDKPAAPATPAAPPRPGTPPSTPVGGAPPIGSRTSPPPTSSTPPPPGIKK